MIGVTWSIMGQRNVYQFLSEKTHGKKPLENAFPIQSELRRRWGLFYPPDTPS
jgi:hypothetical protein